jgi:hypothetical protein
VSVLDIAGGFIMEFPVGLELVDVLRSTTEVEVSSGDRFI